MSNTWETILYSPTPKAWIDKALNSLEILLIDHAHCEKKAASSAISLIHKYPHYNLAKILSPLACLLYTSPSPRDVEESRLACCG